MLGYVTPLEIYYTNVCESRVTIWAKAVANDSVGWVLAGPLLLKVKQNSISQKASNTQKYYGDFWICSACYIMIQ